MILSDIDIKHALESGEIIIDPFDPTGIRPGTYRFTLNDKILIPKWPDEIDARTEEMEYDTVLIDVNGYVLQPGDFILGQTRERLTLGKSLAFIFDARSSLARIGLNVLQGAMFVQPGQTDSHETLEISNISRSPIRIYAGMSIVKGYFARMETPSEHGYDGKYKTQRDMKPIL